MAYNFRKAWNGKNAKRKRRNTVRAIKKGARVAYKGYQLASKVAKMAQMINAEKKRNTLTLTGAGLAQCYANLSGYIVQDITPNPSQGTTSITRTGNSIKLHSSILKLQLYHQANCNAPMIVRINIFRVKGVYQNPSTFITNILALNPFVLNSGSPAIIDVNSTYNPDYFGTFQLVYKKRFTMPMDSYSGVNAIKTFNIPLRHKNHHVRYQSDGSTTSSEGQLIMFMTTDSGNFANTASTLTNIPVTGASTGLIVNYQIQHFFYDN